MDAAPDNARMIQDSARAFLAEHASAERRRAVLEGTLGWDPRLWDGLAGDLGFAGLMVPEAYGGAGLGATDMAAVLEATGSHLAIAPFFETAVLAVLAILGAATASQCATLLPGIAAGGVTATLAGISARPRLIDGRLTGEAPFVSFGHIADLVLVATDDNSLLALPSNLPGMTAHPTPSLDRTRPYATLVFDLPVPAAALLGRQGGSEKAVAQALVTAAGLLAAEQTGGAQFCLDATVAYARQRQQFGRAIGSFQAVKHSLADMMVDIEAARSASLHAATAIDARAGDAAEACHIAAAWAGDCYRRCAGEAIQLHGGIGFTWEHHAQLYFKRARASSTWLGTPARHREALAKLLLEPA